jgi:glycosyltransferase involved in cell wall biosynthesis
LANVQFTGAIPIAQVREEYRRADIFFFPSKWEGSPKVILEAAACGLPVIASAAYEPETVVHGSTGYLASEPEQFFSYLGRLLENPELRCDLGRARRAHAQKFDWAGVTAKWEEIFERLASTATRKRTAAIAASL